MNHKKEIVDTLQHMSGKYSTYEIFSDWIKCCALAISNQSDLFRDNEIWESREQEYLATIQKYTAEEAQEFTWMLAELAFALEDEITDVLGEVYMAAGMGNKSTGQFFTPYHLSEALAGVAIPADISPAKPLVLDEPSTGGGGMIIPAAEILRKRGLNHQRCMEVVAQDLDWKGVYMTYLQLSLLGIKAIVVQGNTLSEPFTDLRSYPKERVLLTPAQKGMLI